MESLADLRFARNYPFTLKAKQIVEAEGISLEFLPETAVERASSLVLAALTKEDYSSSKKIVSSTELLKNEIIAFPIAKMILSKMNSSTALDSFSELISLNAFNSLQEEDNKILIDLASELGIKFEPILSNEFFASMNALDYLKNSFHLSQMKLVNKKIENGKLFLSKNEFIRVMAESIRVAVRNSLPLTQSTFPKQILEKAKQLNTEMEKAYSKKISSFSFGSVKPEFFPPCMKELYNSLINGRNIPHLGRFAIAVFLLRIGMAEENVVNLFSKTPNFNEKITKYQVKRLAEDSISPPGCVKMQEYGLCVSNCNVKNPIQVYRDKLRGSTESKEKETQTQSQKKIPKHFPAGKKEVN